MVMFEHLQFVSTLLCCEGRFNNDDDLRERRGGMQECKEV